MKKYKVVIATEYIVEAEDEHDAMDKAEERMSDDFNSGIAFGDVFSFNAKEIEVSA